MVWKNQTECGYPDQPNGATADNFHELDRFYVTGRLVLLVEKMCNENALINREVTIDDKRYKVIGYESCLIPGHGKGHCSCFAATGLLVREVE